MCKIDTLLSNFVIFFVVFYKFLLFYNVPIFFSYTILFAIFFITFVYFIKRKFVQKRYLMRIFIFMTVCFFISWLNHSANFIFPCLIALACMNRKFKDIVKTFSIAITFCIFITILGNLAGIIESNNIVLPNHDIRYSLGFKHPNGLMFYMLMSIFGFFYAYKFSLKWMFFALIMVLVAYVYTGSRTGLLSSLILFMLFFCTQTLKLKLKFRITSYLYLIMATVTFLSIAAFGIMDLQTVDRLFSNRLQHSFQFLKSGGLFLHPNQNIREQVEAQELIIDNLYVSSIYFYGIIGSLIFAYMYCRSLFLLRYDKKIMIISSVLLIIGISEANLMNFSINYIAGLQAIALIKKEEFEGGSNA